MKNDPPTNPTTDPLPRVSDEELGATLRMDTSPLAEGSEAPDDAEMPTIRDARFLAPASESSAPRPAPVDPEQPTIRDPLRPVVGGTPPIVLRTGHDVDEEAPTSAYSPTVTAGALRAAAPPRTPEEDDFPSAFSLKPAAGTGGVATGRSLVVTVRTAMRRNIRWYGIATLVGALAGGLAAVAGFDPRGGIGRTPARAARIVSATGVFASAEDGGQLAGGSLDKAWTRGGFLLAEARVLSGSSVAWKLAAARADETDAETPAAAFARIVWPVGETPSLLAGASRSTGEAAIRVVWGEEDAVLERRVPPGEEVSSEEADETFRLRGERLLFDPAFLEDWLRPGPAPLVCLVAREDGSTALRLLDPENPRRKMEFVPGEGPNAADGVRPAAAPHCRFDVESGTARILLITERAAIVLAHDPHGAEPFVRVGATALAPLEFSATRPGRAARIEPIAVAGESGAAPGVLVTSVNGHALIALESKGPRRVAGAGSRSDENAPGAGAAVFPSSEDPARDDAAIARADGLAWFEHGDFDRPASVAPYGSAGAPRPGIFAVDSDADGRHDVFYVNDAGEPVRVDGGSREARVVPVEGSPASPPASGGGELEVHWSLVSDSASSDGGGAGAGGRLRATWLDSQGRVVILEIPVAAAP